MLAADIGDAIFLHPFAVPLLLVSMTMTSPSRLDSSKNARRAARCVSTERARSWTGRAMTSSATDSMLSHTVSADAHRTRVSAMRDGASRAARRFHMEATTGAVSFVSQRSGPPMQSRISG